MVARRARSTLAALRGCVLPDRLRRVDQRAGPEGPRNLLLRAVAAQPLQHRSNQRADRPPAAPERERPKGLLDAARRRRARPRSPVAALSATRQVRRLPDRTLRLRSRRNAGDEKADP